MTSDVSELVASAQSGDRSAFDELVRLTYAETYTLALRLVNDSDDAADVVQDAYLRAYKGLDSFRGDAQFSTWLYRITANCASSYLTKRTRHRHSALDEDVAQMADLSPGPEAKADAAVDGRQLAEALAKLPAGLRAAVVLRDIYDLPHQQIAKELGVTEVTAKVRLHRARRKLREQLLPRNGEESDARAV